VQCERLIVGDQSVTANGGRALAPLASFEASDEVLVSTKFTMLVALPKVDRMALVAMLRLVLLE
jgi:hypothetical protein